MAKNSDLSVGLKVLAYGKPAEIVGYTYTGFNSRLAWRVKYEGSGRVVTLTSRSLEPTVKPEPKPQTLNAGTCGVCGRLMRINKHGRIVNHGFTRPGYGYLIGGCFGVGYRPYNKSPQSCVDFAAYLGEYIVKQLAYVARLKSDEFIPMTAKERGSYFDASRRRIVYTAERSPLPGTEEYAKVRAWTIKQVEQQIAYARADQKLMLERDANWKETELEFKAD